MADAVIVGGIRTPFVKAGDRLKDTPAPDLGRWVVRECIDRFDLPADVVDEVIAGNVASPVDAANVARVISLRAGVPRDRIAHTVCRNCGSGFESVTEAIDRVRAGLARCIIALGVDSMSNIPLFWKKSLAEKVWAVMRAKSVPSKLAALARIRPSDLTPQIGLQLGLTDPVSGLIMGETAEKLAREFRISREAQDAFALRSHQRAVAAWESGRLAEETMTVYPQPDLQPLGRDIGPREQQSLEALARLKPYFDRRWGTVTVGNSCQVTDGAAALIVMDRELAQSLGYAPWGRIVDYAYAGCDPARMGLGPVFATARLFQRTGHRLADMELIEINEAFAAQVLACLECFRHPPESCPVSADRLGEIDIERLNVNGGAIALGHPVGATGTRLILTMLHELRRRDATLGLAALCIGGGQGGAVLIERL